MVERVSADAALLRSALEEREQSEIMLWQRLLDMTQEFDNERLSGDILRANQGLLCELIADLWTVLSRGEKPSLQLQQRVVEVLS